MNLHIRDMDAEDFESVFEINQESMLNVFELNANEFFHLFELCEYAKVIEIDHKVAGYIFVLGKGLEYDGEEYNWFCENLGNDFLYIDQVAIGGIWRGIGCGKKLYKDLENYAARNQKNALVCEVNYKPLNQDSMAFHERLGFKEISRMETRGIIVSLLVKQNILNDAQVNLTDKLGGKAISTCRSKLFIAADSV